MAAARGLVGAPEQSGYAKTPAKGQNAPTGF